MIIIRHYNLHNLDKKIQDELKKVRKPFGARFSEIIPFNKYTIQEPKLQFFYPLEISISIEVTLGMIF